MSDRHASYNTTSRLGRGREKRTARRGVEQQQPSEINRNCSLCLVSTQALEKRAATWTYMRSLFCLLTHAPSQHQPTVEAGTNSHKKKKKPQKKGFNHKKKDALNQFHTWIGVILETLSTYRPTLRPFSLFALRTSSHQ